MTAARPGMRSVEFRRERETSWRALERLLARAERTGLDQLPPEDLSRLPVLHRSVLSSLSVARAISLDRNVIEYLETLAARSYFVVYGTRRRLLDSVVEFVGERFPRTVRGMGRPLAASAGALLLGVVVGFLLTTADPDRYYSLVSADMAQGRNPAASTEDLRAVLFDEEASLSSVLTSFASFLFTHNARVAMLCVALGFACGVPVVLLLVYNGLLLGAMSGLYQGRGLGVEWWSWVLPHGVTELLAIVLCGACGLVIGQAIVFPGRHSRLENLALRGREAALVVVGAVAMLFLAALIEGFFRQLVHDLTVRYGVVAATTVGWLLYFAFVGRDRAPRDRAAEPSP